MVSDVSESNLGQVVDGHAQADSPGNISSSRLELERRILERGLVQVDLADHLSSTLVRLHRLQKLTLCVENPYARRAAHLVAGECEEVTVQILDINGHMRHRLRGVYQDPVVGYPDILQLGSLVPSEQLPGDDVAVMLHLGEHDAIA